MSNLPADLQAPIEEWKGKTILLFTPHPDDDTFECGGTLAKLARNGNKIFIVIYTSDNAGSMDPDMTHDWLAQIRKQEEEDACTVLGIPVENIVWFDYDDGMLEYANKRDLTKRITAEIRRYKPDAVFTIDPGLTYDQWHKSDHRSAALLTTDAMRAAGWRLYFPELEIEGLTAWSVPVVYFYYSSDPDTTVDISDVAELKSKASAAHTSQFGEHVKKYDPSVIEAQRKVLAKELMESPLVRREGQYVEKFRRGEDYGQ